MAEPADLPSVHRWFAIEYNNQAWDLLEKQSRSASEDRRLLHLAHAACLHWSEIGTPLNNLRALYLLAKVCAELGCREEALKFAHDCLELSDNGVDGQTLYDRASALESYARANACSDSVDIAAKYKRLAIEKSKEFPDQEEKEMFNQLISTGKWYGIE